MILIAIGTHFKIDGKNYMIDNFGIEVSRSEIIKEWWWIIGVFGTVCDRFKKDKKEFEKIIIKHRFENEKLFINLKTKKNANI